MARSRDLSSEDLEARVGLGRISARPPGQPFRGAFQRLFYSIREAGQSPAAGGSRGEAGASPQAAGAGFSSFAPGQPGDRLRGSGLRPPSYLSLDEQSQASKGLQPDERGPHAAAASSSLPLLDRAFQSCPGDFKDSLGESSLGQAPASGARPGAAPAAARPAGEGNLGESGQELCRAVSASLGLAWEALDAPGRSERATTRDDCMFARPGAHARALTLGGSTVVEAEPESGGGALSITVPGHLSLYKDSPATDEPSAAAFRSRDCYDFQPALRIKLESTPAWEAAAGGWGAPRRRAAEMPALASRYRGSPGPGWHPSLAEKRQIDGPGAESASFRCGRSQGPAGPEGSDLSSEARYPGGVVGKRPFAPGPGCIRAELSPWMEGCAGAYGNVRLDSARDHILPIDYYIEPQKTCLICADEASGCHYGVVTCGSCKVFFKRAAEGKQNYLCAGQNDCTIDKLRRKNCASCRLRKCYEAGMTFGGRKLKKLGNLKLQEGGKTAGPSNPTEEQGLKEPVSHVASLECQPIFLNLLEATEPGMDCVSHDNNQPDFFAALLTSLNGLGERQLLHVVKWAKALLGFRNLHVDDQVAIIPYSWNSLMIFAMGWRSITSVNSWMLYFAPDLFFNE
ncbi:androgen receptor-like [Elgaria multicarinata webbii]|uniref:androgen receptor-like n=1 Tax=Elgaria multicarinata webbii TaxID=159646 RepID=UPI002FCCC79A